ncbi:UNVERIFIED_CONTAM: Stp1/IreP family PP2C-type Ser/Thr phosphatase [Halobacillus marinus]|uniref:Stp1/IreP family PP2C-type Ser/Thr phosphatase n=1 Tax=Bacillaceae TaxID=186817 RepID=UPI0002A52076|nr:MULTISPECIES: Stp1/IreP family PP2C-type Ser/Thr phosphatase [Bacillaceae]ELK46137.1 protein serine/threonine phosphatase [Halobacillus sp. BAB-2008]QHT46601.1 Stp1/IreP family PP2C-type Ser/Thr phosphatase [Bacillus sp. SB49]
MLGYFLTDQGQVRNHNEDAGGVFSEKAPILAVVADGMGGHQAGDVASRMATDHLHNKWKESGTIATPEEAEQWMIETVRSANDEIKAYADEHEECQGMGTTIVAAISTDQFATIAHIGDSRCYLANAYGFQSVTDDHSLVNELVRTGQITEEEAEHHPRKNVLLKALGTEFGLEPDVRTLEFEKDDRLLLCTDGLTNKVNDQELSELKDFHGEWEDFCRRLIELANARGGEDNITLAVVHYDSATHEKEGVQ